MKKLVALLLGGLMALGCSSPRVVTRYFTNGERKEMLVKDGVSIQWNSDYSIRNKCEFKNGRPYNGRWITEWRRNLLHEERGYKDGRLHGDRIIYDWQGRPKWGRGYYMGVVSKKMIYKGGELRRVDEYPQRVEKVKKKAERLARKIEERERKRQEKEKEKRLAIERKRAEKEKRLKEREEERKRKAREREEAEKKRLEEEEGEERGEDLKDLDEEISSLKGKVQEQKLLLEKLEQEQQKKTGVEEAGGAVEGEGGITGEGVSE